MMFVAGLKDNKSTAEAKKLVAKYFGGRDPILQGVAPPDDPMPLNFPQHAQAAIQRVFADCAADSGCHAAFPDLHLTIEDLIADGDLVVARMTLHGTHQGSFQGLAPTNKHVSVFAVDVVRIQDGRFREHWGGPDMLPLLQQLGATVSTDGPR